MSVKEASEKSSASVEIKCSKFYQMGCNRDLQKLICILAKKLHVKTGMKIIRQVKQILRHEGKVHVHM